MSVRRVWPVLVIVAGTLAGRASAKGAPDWVAAVIASQVPAGLDSADAVVLLDEHTLLLDGAGRWSERQRRVVRVKDTAGRDAALARVYYGEKAGPPPDLEAWRLVAGDAGRATHITSVADFAASADPLASELRVREIDQRESVIPGDVFAWESNRRFHGAFAQQTVGLGDEYPVVRARVTCTVPPGWTLTWRVWGAAPVRDTVTGDTHVWEALALPGSPDEDDAPPPGERLTQLLLGARPPGRVAGVASFERWRDVTEWLDALRAPSAASDPALEARARDLVAGARTRLDSVAAIARFVQDVRYVSLELRLAEGGGFTPRPAADVLAKSYGDCKDKANLMCALLGAVGVDARLVLVNVTEPGVVDPGWPSPALFDHCIVAVTDPDAMRWPCGVRGRGGAGYLIFDPTNPNTCLGDLPRYEQGARALLLGPEGDSLVTLPQLPVTARRLARRIEATLDADGVLQGSSRTVAYGQQGAEMRALERAGAVLAGRVVETEFARETGGGSIDSMRVLDDPASGRFERVFGFTLRHYGRRPTDRMMTFRVAPRSLPGLPAIDARPRRQPLDIHEECVRETVVVALPEGWRPDDLPPPVTRTTPFGTFSCSAAAEAGRLMLTRSLDIERQRLAPERVEEWRRFVREVARADAASAVLVRP